MRKKRLYVIGYDSDADIVFGKNDPEYQDSCLPMTATQAKRELKCYEPGATIYKLVPVAPEDI